MNKDSHILITGGAGFIGSALVKIFNNHGIQNLILCDTFHNKEKIRNLEGKQYTTQVEADRLFDYLQQDHRIGFIFHFGAKAGAYAMDKQALEKYNLEYSQKIWDYATLKQIPLIYATTGATYGTGTFGFTDDVSTLKELGPVNEYARSKHRFDLWANSQEKSPPFWAGLKLFNVFGPNEYHKGKRASMVYHCYRQIVEKGYATLFGSFNPAIADGEYKRDLIYLKDVLDICFWFYDQIRQNHKKLSSGIFNVGTGIPVSFNDIAFAVFAVLKKEASIQYQPIPEDIRNGYPEISYADTGKLRLSGYTSPFTPLDEGVADYVQNYLIPKRYF